MKYKITVIKFEDNENFEAEMAQFKEKDDGYMRGRFAHETGCTPPDRDKATRALEVYLTEEEYKKVKAEVIKIFE